MEQSEWENRTKTERKKESGSLFHLTLTLTLTLAISPLLFVISQSFIWRTQLNRIMSCGVLQSKFTAWRSYVSAIERVGVLFPSLSLCVCEHVDVDAV